MTSGTPYELVLRGELGDGFGFEGMRLERREGTTILTGMVSDQAQLFGMLDRIQDLGLELVSIRPTERSS